MKFILLALFVAAIVLVQAPNQPQQKQAQRPTIGFAETTDGSAITDTDVFDEQKYVEEGGGDSANVKTKRAAHETTLMREFMAGFNDTKECDGVVLIGKGDHKPGFSMQVFVDSHDTPGQKPVWNWVLRDLSKNKLMAHGQEDSGKVAARDICLAVLKDANPNRIKTGL